MRCLCWLLLLLAVTPECAAVNAAVRLGSSPEVPPVGGAPVGPPAAPPATVWAHMSETASTLGDVCSSWDTTDSSKGYCVICGFGHVLLNNPNLLPTMSLLLEAALPLACNTPVELSSASPALIKFAPALDEAMASFIDALRLAGNTTRPSSFAPIIEHVDQVTTSYPGGSMELLHDLLGSPPTLAHFASIAPTTFPLSVASFVPMVARLTSNETAVEAESDQVQDAVVLLETGGKYERMDRTLTISTMVCLAVAFTLTVAFLNNWRRELDPDTQTEVLTRDPDGLTKGLAAVAFVFALGALIISMKLIMRVFFDHTVAERINPFNLLMGLGSFALASMLLMWSEVGLEMSWFNGFGVVSTVVVFGFMIITLVRLFFLSEIKQKEIEAEKEANLHNIGSFDTRSTHSEVIKKSSSTTLDDSEKIKMKQQERISAVENLRLTLYPLFINFFILWLFAIVYFFLAGDFKNTTGTNSVTNFYDAFYFAAVTQTTVGYGDMLPKSMRLRWAVSFHIMLCYMLWGAKLYDLYKSINSAKSNTDALAHEQTTTTKDELLDHQVSAMEDAIAVMTHGPSVGVETTETFESDGITYTPTELVDPNSVDQTPQVWYIAFPPLPTTEHFKKSVFYRNWKFSWNSVKEQWEVDV